MINRLFLAFVFIAVVGCVTPRDSTIGAGDAGRPEVSAEPEVGAGDTTGANLVRDARADVPGDVAEDHSAGDLPDAPSVGGSAGSAGGGGATGTGGAAGSTCVVGTGLACSTGALGICAMGVKTCQLVADQSTRWGPCVQNAAKGSRDCTSGNDNDCNGQPDDTESAFCQCSLNNSPRACSSGMSGICMAGRQICVVSSDKSTSAWGACTQLKAKGTETCANPGTDDDCNGAVDDVPTSICNVGNGAGACANGGHTACNGTTQVCNPAVSAIGDATSTTWHNNAAPNGSWDWNCDGVVTKQYPDQAPPPPDCTGLSMSACSSVPPVEYALNPFACGDLGDIGKLYCVWLAAIPGCTNKSGQSTGYQQGCR